MTDFREAPKRLPLVPPVRSAMPDLSSLFRKNTLSVMLAHVFTGAGPTTVRAAILLRAYVRLVDKALEDYELCRMAFAEYVNRASSSTFSPLFRAIGHMENCLYSVERALRFARRLGEESELGATIPPLGVLRKDSLKRVGILRNGTEHLDDRVIRGAVSEGDLSAIWMDEEYMELENTRIHYSEFGTWLTELHGLAVALAKFRPGDANAQPNR